MADIKTNPENLWRVVSRGYAAENLELGQNMLEVFCPELSGFADGEIVAQAHALTTQGFDDTGNNYTVKIITTNSIKTKWRQQGTNRITPPCIRRGERIEVWQYADTDMYYWTPSGEDDHLRRKETVTWAFSNTTDESTEELNPENSYWAQVNTHEKIVALETSQSDGEPYKHAIQIDTKNGNFHYRDSAGNYLQVEAGGNKITIENGDGTVITLDKADATLKVPGNLTIDCGSLNIKTGTMEVGASAIQTNAKSVGISGNIQTTGKLTNNGTNVGSGHVHGGVRSGGDSTRTPS